MNKTLLEFLDEASPRELLEAYFDAKTHQKDSISLLPDELVSICVANVTQAIDKLPVYGENNKVFTREKYFAAKQRLKSSGFKF